MAPTNRVTNGRGFTDKRIRTRLFGLALFALFAGLAAAGSWGEAARANPMQHVWVHYDYMVAADGRSDAPDPAAIQLVVDAFAAHGIQLHIDPEHTAIPETEFVIFKGQGFGYGDCGIGPPVEFSNLKDEYFHPTSNHEWHYAIFGFNGGLCGSGIADLPGDDLFIALGRDLPILQQEPRDVMLAQEGGTFMHELGHNLNLHHGGDDDINYKPNYLSVMNYAYQLGIPYASTPGSTTQIGLRLDYSEQALPPLDESNLSEPLGVQDWSSTDIVRFRTAITDQYNCAAGVRPGIGPASGPIDWNLNGVVTDINVTTDINGDGCAPEVLTGFDDWTEVHQYLATKDKHPKQTQVETS